MRITKIVLPFLAIVLLISCSKEEIANKQLIPQLDLSSGKAPLLANDPNAKYIPGDYVVVFNDDVDIDAEVGRAEKAHGIKAKLIYKYAFKGFAATLPIQALESLRSNPKIKYIEQDQEVFAIATTQDLNNSFYSWGIDRIDSKSLILDKKYTYTANGNGVDAYIIDTGIKFDHQEFVGRAKFGFDAWGGHGTHVSGTVGGKNVGVAKNVSLVAVRVLNNAGSGSTSGVISGINWIISNHTTKPAVANMSLGGGMSDALDLAVRNAISDGIVMCVAAGNSNVDASGTSGSSPARVIEAITVAASDNTDTKASYSNFGSVVDIFAPGSNIFSSWKTNSMSYNTISGTSMATPHVTGVAALILQGNPLLSCSDVEAILKTNASLNTAVKNVPAGTTSALLYSNF
jgi:subtilisin family serine protease